MSKYNFKKSECEKYTISLNDGWNFAIISIDDTGFFSCYSSFGNYSYLWNHFGSCFKKFLISTNSSYLFEKLCVKDYFDITKYITNCKKEIFSLRKQTESNNAKSKSVTRELYTFFEELDSDNTFDTICEKVWNNKTISDLFDIYESEFMPEKTYSANSNNFIEKVFPIFQTILKEELSEEENKNTIIEVKS
jgi:hypothetical protein